MGKFIITIKDRSRIKVFEQVEHVSKRIPYVDGMMISYGFILRELVNQL